MGIQFKGEACTALVPYRGPQKKVQSDKPKEDLLLGDVISKIGNGVRGLCAKALKPMQNLFERAELRLYTMGYAIIDGFDLSLIHI